MRLLFVLGSRGLRGLWKPTEPGLCGGRSPLGVVVGFFSRDTLVWTLDSEPRLPGYTSLLVPKDCPFSPEKSYYLTACSSREKVVIGDC